MANKDKGLFGSNEFHKRLKQQVDGLDRAVVKLEARVTKLEAGSMAALVKAANRIAHALENPPLPPDMGKLLVQLKANDAGIKEAQDDGKETGQTKES